MRSNITAISLSFLATASVAYVAVSAPPVKKIETSVSSATYKRVRGFVDKYCIGCHGASGAAAGINLSKPTSLEAMLNDRATWDKVIGTVESQAIHDALLDLLCKAKALAVDVTPGERTTLATRHICRHADGKPCVESEELTDTAACVVEARDKLATAEPKVK